MPHRLIELPSFLVHALEASLLGIALGWNAFAYKASLIADDDWSKITGPHGVAFIAVVAVIVLWVNKINADKRQAEIQQEQARKEDVRRAEEEHRREQRHAETLSATNGYAESLKALAVESAKVTMRVDHTLSELTEQLKSRPCQAVSFKPTTKP